MIQRPEGDFALGFWTTSLLQPTAFWLGSVTICYCSYSLLY